MRISRTASARRIEENLLSYEQFQRVFERERPQASLLFNTGGEGYFAYCVIAPQLIEKGVEAPIVGENALDGVEKYLARRKEQEAGPGRPKILTVDNSAEYRQGIRALLREDYDVAETASGLGAIRAVILDRPDLVLMDYELSICDGKQILEMLRADEDFRDLPVIFLTGRRDTASMIQVMPLKPAGYLLKSEKPQELKRKIDAFFEKR